MDHRLAFIPLRVAIVSFLISGCATPTRVGKGMSPQVLYSYGCSPGMKLSSVKGTVSIQVQSKEISGRFLAHAQVASPEHLKFEVVNFLGGTEALISVQKDHFEIFSAHADQIQNPTRDGFWAGVPLRWAAPLFLGRIPCPSSSEQLRMSVDSDGQLEILSPSADHKPYERFIFRFREVDGKPWPYQLTWENRVTDKGNREEWVLNTVEFKFDDPENHSSSPTQWEAQSALGRVKVRWRKRELFSAMQEKSF